MICPSCQRETAPFAELGDMGGRMIRKCGFAECGAILPPDPPPRVSPKLQTVAVVSGAPVSKQFPPPASSNGAPPSFERIVADAEARLLVVRDRLAELRSLETEEKRLVLILSAAGKAIPENLPS